MKIIRIQLDRVEEALLLEVQKINPEYKDLRQVLLNQIRLEYSRKAKGKRQQ